MRKLKLIEHISLDGVIQASGEDDFPYSAWTAPYGTPVVESRETPDSNLVMRFEPSGVRRWFIVRWSDNDRGIAP